MKGILKSSKRKIIVLYPDNIMIHSDTLLERVVHVPDVLTLLTDHGLKAKHAKCAYAGQNVHSSSIDIDLDGIHTQEHK